MYEPLYSCFMVNTVAMNRRTFKRVFNCNMCLKGTVDITEVTSACTFCSKILNSDHRKKLLHVNLLVAIKNLL